jgi:ceramide glucosyltransferase
MIWSVVRALAVPGTGLVTHVFAGSGERTFGAALENLQLAAAVPAIVAARALVGRALTVGKSMGMRRRDLVLLGGFARFGDVLAEDHALGVAFAEAGHGIRTSLDVIVNVNTNCGVERTIERHTRWAKLRRVIVPGAFAVEPFLSPLFVASVAAVVSRTTVGLGVVLIAALVQIAGSAIAMRRLRGRLARA